MKYIKIKELKELAKELHLQLHTLWCGEFFAFFNGTEWIGYNNFEGSFKLNKKAIKEAIKQNRKRLTNIIKDRIKEEKAKNKFYKKG